MYLLIDTNLLEEFAIGKGTIELSAENGPEVDDLFRAVFKADTECKRPDLLEAFYSVNVVTHGDYLNALILAGGRPACKARQSARSSS